MFCTQSPAPRGPDPGQQLAQDLLGLARDRPRPRGGRRDPEGLGRQLAVLFEGVTALSTSLNDGWPADDARRAGITLIDAAMAGE